MVVVFLLTGSSWALAQSYWRLFAGAGIADGGETIVAGNIVTDGTNKLTPYLIKARWATT